MEADNPLLADRPQLLLVDDDETLCSVLSQALEKRGFMVNVAHSINAALAILDGNAPEYAVIDLKMPDGSGLALVAELKSLDPHTKIVVFTGHSSIVTAVEAIKLGAIYYLSKPADADDIMAAFQRDEGNVNVLIDDKPPSVERLEWDHINHILMANNGNISATARALGMHRRTLQRKLFKRPPRH